MRIVGLEYNGKIYDSVDEVEDAIREHLSKNANNIDIPDEWIEYELDNNVDEVIEEL